MMLPIFSAALDSPWIISEVRCVSSVARLDTETERCTWLEISRIGAAAHLLGAAADPGDDTLHALLEAAGELAHHARAIRLGGFTLCGGFQFHATHGQRIFAEHLDGARHAADLIARLAARD